MDKQKIKIILIAVACLLAIFLLYRTLSKVSDNKIAAAGKVDMANADLEIKQNQDAYTSVRESQKKTDEENKVEMISETQLASGYMTLSDYIESLSNDERSLYNSMRTDYIRVMGVDPGLMSLSDLQKWSDYYQEWRKLNHKLYKITSESKSFLDPDFDTIEEMEAAIVAAETAVLNGKEQLQQNWIDAHTEFISGLPALKAIGLDILKKWLPYPEDLVPLRENFINRQHNFLQQRMPQLDRLFDRLKDYFNGGYIVWKSGLHVNVKGANDIPEGTLNEVGSLSYNDMAYLTDKLRQTGGFSIYTRVQGNNPSEKRTFTNFVDACLAIASFQQQCKESVSVAAAILTAGISVAIEKNNKTLSYMPERAKYVFERAEAATGATWTYFGVTESGLDSVVGAYSQNTYRFGDYMYDQIDNGKATIWDWVESEDYKGI